MSTSLERYIPRDQDVGVLRSNVHRNALYTGLSYGSDRMSLSRYEHQSIYFTFYWVDSLGDITRYDWTPEGIQITPHLDASFVFVESVGLDRDMAPTRGNWAFFRIRNADASRCTPGMLSEIALSQICDTSYAWGFMFLSRLMSRGVVRDSLNGLREYWSYIVNRTVERYVSPYCRDHYCLPRDFTEFGRRRA
ncbi:hypothetical protein Moror_8505 [Moniliophthora roreri MCA 2997]|uniref:Uncharacterized protein n=2 Tax=Moniliophthora roreri TaxID=221103 RepID=V2WJS3_MONRO|nr:hypothetical protein Moror_8505 [Moniliophthora roreri MCA 2997]